MRAAITFCLMSSIEAGENVLEGWKWLMGLEISVVTLVSNK